jgi:hypothetical protein
MTALRTVFVLAIVGIFLGSQADTALAQKGKKKGKGGKFGRVTELKVDNGVGTITIATKKKGDSQSTSKTFNVTKNTVVQKAPTEKGGNPASASLSDLQADPKKGTLVSITTADDGSAATIQIIPPMKKKKKSDT